jgi:hypothetical protein
MLIAKLGQRVLYLGFATRDPKAIKIPLIYHCIAGQLLWTILRFINGKGLQSSFLCLEGCAIDNMNVSPSRQIVAKQNNNRLAEMWRFF